MPASGGSKRGAERRKAFIHNNAIILTLAIPRPLRGQGYNRVLKKHGGGFQLRQGSKSPKMSFWGVEVKPGKPFTHYFDRTVGRLRVSQATLGIGSRTARSLVQCNVGNKSPVFLCALLPNKIESCHLDLEFEEADDVVFSVLGPRSVHLSGYYVSKSSSANRNSDTESYGEDIANTDTEASDLGSENDDYGGSFIDDDDDGKEVEDEEGEPNVFLSSPIYRNGNAGNKKGNHKGLKKKNRQAVEPADNINSEERGDEMNSTMAVLRNKKSANKCNVIESEDDNNEQESKGGKSYLLTAFGNEIPECGETADKVTGDVAAPSQSGGRDEDHRGEDDVPVEVTNMSNSCNDCPEPDARSTKTSDDAKDQAVGMSILENVYADDNTEQFTDHDISQALKGTKDAQSAVSDMNIGNLSVSLDHLADVQVENRQKLKRKKDLEGDRLGECNGSGPGDAGEELKQVVENDDHYTSLDLSACEQAENGPKLKKQKKGSREGEWDDCQASSHVDGVVELKQDVKTTDRGNESLPTTEATQVLTTIQ
ncbi:unnamed protein product [Cuscuta campestris]|uniref:peptidylprolyl isomerase n=1 Tax=Cuscuta campestris TaxID=132261 RepID=A0A484MCE1_9ASTE|nr:unnamed protein product [Cuscuta campestris]